MLDWKPVDRAAGEVSRGSDSLARSCIVQSPGRGHEILPFIKSHLYSIQSSYKKDCALNLDYTVRS
jgi:hypothetical protein